MLITSGQLGVTPGEDGAPVLVDGGTGAQLAQSVRRNPARGPRIEFLDPLCLGDGRVAETPGGWRDFIAQNPGFFRFETETPAKPKASPAPPPAPKRAVKLSFKDQHRLGELEKLTMKLPADITALERRLEDPGLYARDPSGFDRIMKDLNRMRAQLSAAEDEWLTLEEKREAMTGG